MCAPLKLQASGLARWAQKPPIVIHGVLYMGPYKWPQKICDSWGYFILLLRAPQLHIYIIYNWFWGGPPGGKMQENTTKTLPTFELPLLRFLRKKHCTFKTCIFTGPRIGVLFKRFTDRAACSLGSRQFGMEKPRLNMPGPPLEKGATSTNQHLFASIFNCFGEFIIPDINQHAL